MQNDDLKKKMELRDKLRNMTPAVRKAWSDEARAASAAARASHTQESLDQHDSLHSMEQAGKYNDARAAGKTHEEALGAAGADPKDLVRPSVPLSDNQRLEHTIHAQNYARLNVPVKYKQSVADYVSSPKFHDDTVRHFANRESEIRSKGYAQGPHPAVRAVQEHVASLRSKVDAARDMVKGGPGPGNKVEKAWSDAAREASAEARRNRSGVKGPKSVPQIKTSRDADRQAEANLSSNEIEDYRGLDAGQRNKYIENREIGASHRDAISDALDTGMASFHESGHTEAAQRAIDDSKKPGYDGPKITDATGRGGKIPPKPTAVKPVTDDELAEYETLNSNEKKHYLVAHQGLAMPGKSHKDSIAYAKKAGIKGTPEFDTAHKLGSWKDWTNDQLEHVMHNPTGRDGKSMSQHVMDHVAHEIEDRATATNVKSETIGGKKYLTGLSRNTGQPMVQDPESKEWVWRHNTDLDETARRENKARIDSALSEKVRLQGERKAKKQFNWRGRHTSSVQAKKDFESGKTPEGGKK